MNAGGSGAHVSSGVGGLQSSDHQAGADLEMISVDYKRLFKGTFQPIIQYFDFIIKVLLNKHLKNEMTSYQRIIMYTIFYCSHFIMYYNYICLRAIQDLKTFVSDFNFCFGTLIAGASI